MVKRLPSMWETWIRSLGQENPLEKEMATHSSTRAWKIPRMEELGAGYFPWGRKESGVTKRLTLSLSYLFSGEILCHFILGCFLITEF